jgi:hypothetical protein
MIVAAVNCNNRNSQGFHNCLHMNKMEKKLLFKLVTEIRELKKLNPGVGCCFIPLFLSVEPPIH